MTYQKKKRRNAKAVKTGENTSASYTSIGGGWKGVAKSVYSKLVGKKTVTANSSTTLTSTQGKQGNFSYYLWDRTQLDDLTTVVTGGTASANVSKVFLGKGKSTLFFRNQTNDAGIATIYDIVVGRQACASTIDTPIEAWVKGDIDFGSATMSNTVGQTPFHSPEFNRHYRVHKVTRVPMEAGQTHTHVVRHNVNKALSSIRWQNTSAPCILGLTVTSLVVFHGGIGHESTTNANVTFMPMKLDIINVREYSFAYMESNAPTYAVTDALATTVVDFDFMGEDQDVDANLNAA